MITFYELTTPTAKAPTRSTAGAAGFDLYACNSNPIEIPPFGRALVMTGVKLLIPFGRCGLVCPRSGLALKHGITVLNAPGIIDADYRGEVGVVLYNTGCEYFSVKNGDRIAQIVFTDSDMNLNPGPVASDTKRGEGGFGSTGV